MIILFMIVLWSVQHSFEQINVALVSNGATCTSSQSSCNKAIDGVSQTTSNSYRWSFSGIAVGKWLRVTFSQTHTIYTARFMQLAFGDEKNFKDLILSFYSGSNQKVTLTNRSNGFIWEEFNLNPPVETTYVDIEILSSYSSGFSYNGFNEVEFYDGLFSTTPTTTTTTPTTTTPTTTITTSTITTTPTTTTTTTTTTTPTTTTPTTTTTTPTTTTTTPTTTTTTPTTTTTTPTATTTTPTTTTTTPTTTTTTPTTTTTTPTTTTTTPTTTTTTTTTPTTTTTTSMTTTTRPTTIITISSATRTQSLNEIEDLNTERTGTTGLAVGICVAIIIIIIVALGSLFYRWRKTQNELNNIKKERGTVYYNVEPAGVGADTSPEYEDIDDRQMSLSIKGLYPHKKNSESCYEHLESVSRAQDQPNTYTDIGHHYNNL